MSRWGGKAKGAAWGGTIGMVGGPLGSLIGAAIGGWLGHQEDEQKKAQDQIQFILKSVLKIYAGAAHANGTIHPKEKQRIQTLGHEIIREVYPDVRTEQINEILNEFLSNETSFDECCQLFSFLDQEFQPVVFRGALSVLAADGCIDEQELNWLGGLVAQSDADPDVWRLNLMFYHREPSHGAEEIREAAELLELPEAYTEDDVKKGWKRKMADYHPDKLMGVPAPVRKLAKEHARKVNEAYEILQQRNKSPSLRGLSVRSTGSAFVGADAANAGSVANCFLCEQKNRLPCAERIHECRCGKCFAFLAIPTELAEFVMS